MSLLNSIAGVLTHFNALDYCFVAVLAIAMLAGGIKGFCKQVVSWFFWIVAGYVAYFYSSDLAELFLSNIISTQILRVLVVDLCLLAGAMFLVFAVNRVMQGLLILTGMSVFDRFLGVYFGMLQGVVLIAIVVTGFTSTGVKNESWWKGSRVVVMTSTLMPIYADDMGRLIDYSLKGLNKMWMGSIGNQFSWGIDGSKD